MKPGRPGPGSIFRFATIPPEDPEVSRETNTIVSRQRGHNR